MEAIAIAFIAAVTPFLFARFDAQRADKKDAEMEEIAKSLGMDFEAARIRQRRQYRVETYASKPLFASGTFDLVKSLLIYSAISIFIGSSSFTYYLIATISEESANALRLAKGSLLIASILLLISGSVIMLQRKRRRRKYTVRPRF